MRRPPLARRRHARAFRCSAQHAAQPRLRRPRCGQSLPFTLAFLLRLLPRHPLLV